MITLIKHVNLEKGGLLFEGFGGYLHDTLLDWPIGTIGAILLVLALAGAVGFIAWGIFVAIDSWFLPKKVGQGNVISRWYSPSDDQTTIIDGMVYSTPVPDSWSVGVKLTDDREASMSVSESTYDLCEKVRGVTVEYVEGRLSGRVYLKSIVL